ncbi:unnamed protein product [Kluyveromyces dobzhanskii CBS 2104]|uniref:WGS project CCBQ000000000 data, contig 00058 n=1 Tax=Kluyveromyces dobzhanskii CBS 2104 TaxID=1427455 RepID=A0A0A8LDN5_9SACH|nr:unnamed protein product [Kluyveromyces dobzhanskii CBS 2104]
MGNMKLACFLLVSLSLWIESAFGYRNVVQPKHTTTTSETPKPWIRTIYGTQREIVTPTVIAGVTFGRQPQITPDPLEPWVSLKKDGSPQTVKPQIKNGRTKNGAPDYGSYFKTASTTTYSEEELVEMGIEPDGPHEEEKLVDEDITYLSLNPIIRCTPNRYFNKGSSKDVSSAPFCTPKENADLKVSKTYFVSWYTRFFENDEGVKDDEVRLHLSYVKEKAHEKGYAKRDLTGTFFSSEWLKNLDGMYPLEISEEWLQGSYTRKIIISVQPKSISDDEFDPFETGVVANIILGSKVFKTTKEQLALQDQGITEDTWYYVAMTIPTVVLFAVVFMYFFVQLNSKYRDFSDVKRQALNQKRKVIGKFKDIKKYRHIKNHKYDELPLHKSSKQS